MLKLQLWLIIQRIIFFFRKKDYARITVVFLFLAILLALCFTSYLCGKYFINYIGTFDRFSYALLKFILLSLVWSISILSLLSFAIAFFQTLFGQKLYFFFLAQIAPYKIALSVFLLTLIFGSWPYLLLSFPFLLGMIQRQDVSFLGFLQLLFLHVLISIIQASFASTLILLLRFFLGRRLVRVFPFVLLLSLMGFYLFFTRIIYPANLSLMVTQQSVSSVEESLRTLPLSAPFLPPTLFVGSILGEKLSFVWLTLETVLSLSLFMAFSLLIYRRLWQASFEGFLLANRTAFFPKKKRFSTLINFFPQSAWSFFFAKEFYAIKRSMNAIFYLSFIVFLSAVITFFLSLATHVKGDYAQFGSVVTLAGLFAFFYITLLVTIRFVFPSFAQEAPYLWLLITTYGIRRKLLISKWIFYHLFVLFLIGLLVAVNHIYSQVSRIDLLSAYLLFISNGIIATVVALLLGQLFQRELPKNDVEAITTTIPGLLVTSLSLLIGILLTIFATFQNILDLAKISFMISVLLLLISFRISADSFKKCDL